jgi:hypothetical protein
VDGDGDAGEGVRVPAGVVGAEEELAGGQLDTDVRLRATGITPVLGGESRDLE